MAAEIECYGCGHPVHEADDCRVIEGYDHLNGDHECGCTLAPRPDFDVHAVQHGEVVAVPEGWAMIIAGPERDAEPGAPDVVLAGWDTADTFHQYADTETIARALVSYLQDVIHV